MPTFHILTALPSIKPMKYLTIIVILISNFTFGQTENHREKFRQLEPDIWLGLWDKEHSDKSIKIDTLS